MFFFYLPTQRTHQEVVRYMTCKLLHLGHKARWLNHVIQEAVICQQIALILTYKSNGRVSATEVAQNLLSETQNSPG